MNHPRFIAIHQWLFNLDAIEAIETLGPGDRYRFVFRGGRTHTYAADEVADVVRLIFHSFVINRDETEGDGVFRPMPTN